MLRIWRHLHSDSGFGSDQKIKRKAVVALNILLEMIR